MRKFMIAAGLSVVCLAAFAGGEPACKQVTKRVVENANPQHAGYPKANQKGDMPERIDIHRYVITTCNK